MTRTRKTTLLITSVTVGASTLMGAITSPAGATEVARYNLTQAWPPATIRGPSRRSPWPDPAARSAGKVEFEWKVEEGES